MSHILATWSIALLLGGMTIFSVVFAPLVFRRLPAEHAGRFIRAVFPWYYLYVLVCSGMATLWLALTPGRDGVAWMMLVVFVAGLYARQWLMPAINQLRDAAEAGDAAAADCLERRHTRSVWIDGAQWLAALVACALVAGTPARQVPAHTSPEQAARVSAAVDRDCSTASGWVDAQGHATHLGRLIDHHAGKRVWLLGEQHAQPAHHAWQLEVLSALHAREPKLALAMEMFPREAQPALDAWVAGNIDWQTLLTTSHWQEVWGFPAEFYRPLLEFARRHRVPVIGMNVHPTATQAVARGGRDALPAELRAELGTPAAPSPRYREALEEAFRMHRSKGLGHPGHDAGDDGTATDQPDVAAGEAGPGPGADTAAGEADPGPGADTATGEAHPGPGADTAALERFIEAQLTWDRAMATAILRTLDQDAPPAQVVALLGQGHTGHGRGVPLQLEDLDLHDTVSLLPSEPGSACGGAEANPLMADARFVLPPESVGPLADMALPPRSRLGVALGTDVQGARILWVEPGSLADQEGLQAGDVILELAGRRCESPRQVVEAVQRQPAGTWLPIRIQRDREERAQVIRFPNEPR